MIVKNGQLIIKRDHMEIVNFDTKSKSVSSRSITDGMPLGREGHGIKITWTCRRLNAWTRPQTDTRTHWQMATLTRGHIDTLALWPKGISTRGQINTRANWHVGTWHKDVWTHGHIATCANTETIDIFVRSPTKVRTETKLIRQTYIWSHRHLGQIDTWTNRYVDKSTR